MTGIERIVAERQRQIEVEGWTPEHDAQHAEGELALAAAANAVATTEARTAYVLDESGGRRELRFVDLWPSWWAARWDKRAMIGNDVPKKIRLLEMAGALIAAEIDRLLRQTEKT